jgi:histidyl-tRNA synthetase
MEKIIAPKGTRDICYPEIRQWQRLEERIRRFFAGYGYQEIRTPVFEHSELFSRGIGDETEVVLKEMYTFRDKGERSLTLRPENTASVVRAAIEGQLFNTLYPLRFLYIGPMFRYDKPQKGRYRQFHQFGVEIFGEDHPLTDAEVIESASRFLADLGIQNTELLINSVGCPACRPAYLEALRAAALPHEAAYCADCRRKIQNNPLRIFDCKVPGCRELAQELPLLSAHLCDDCRDHHRQVRLGLDQLGVPHREDPMLVRGLDYYQKTAFEITSNHLGAQNALLGGGRYNGLIRQLGGGEVAGIGFAAGIERVLLHMPPQAEETSSVIYVAYQSLGEMNAAMQLAQELRTQGFPVLIDYGVKGLGKLLKKADRAGAAMALILGEEEIAQGKVMVKMMAEQTQKQIERKELVSWLKEQN